MDVLALYMDLPKPGDEDHMKGRQEAAEDERSAGGDDRPAQASPIVVSRPKRSLTAYCKVKHTIGAYGMQRASLLCPITACVLVVVV